MGRHCAAFGCTNSDEKNKKLSLGLTFHAFPIKRPSALKAWDHAVKRKDFKPTNYSFLCSDHFKEDDFQSQPFTAQRQVKPDAVPSRFSFTSQGKTRKRTTYEIGQRMDFDSMEEEKPCIEALRALTAAYAVNQIRREPETEQDHIMKTVLSPHEEVGPHSAALSYAEETRHDFTPDRLAYPPIDIKLEEIEMKDIDISVEQPGETESPEMSHIRQGTSATSEYRRRLKVENPERYAAYLLKEKERSRAAREKKKAKCENRPPTRGMVAEKKREKALSSQRMDFDSMEEEKPCIEALRALTAAYAVNQIRREPETEQDHIMKTVLSPQEEVGPHSDALSYAEETRHDFTPDRLAYPPIDIKLEEIEMEDIDISVEQPGETESPEMSHIRQGTSATSEYRRRLKVENPERYAAYLLKEKERSRAAREKKKAKCENRPPTCGMVVEKKREKALSRKRAAKHNAKFATLHSEQPRARVETSIFSFKEMSHIRQGTSATSEYRRRLRVENPERYAAYLLKERERSRAARIKNKAKWENEPRTRDMVEKKEREKALPRERAVRHKSNAKFATPCIEKRRFRVKTSISIDKRPKEMTPSELLQHKRELKALSRARQNPQEKTLAKKKDRDYKRAKRQRRRKTGIIRERRDSEAKASAATTAAISCTCFSSISVISL